MGKAKRGSNEYTREQRLTKENKDLKLEISRLRKLLARVDLDRYEQVREIIEEHYTKDREDEGKIILDKMKQEWKCHTAGCEGYLEITLFNKINDTWYYRKCNCCPNRTKSQKYTPDVRGIIKNKTS